MTRNQGTVSELITLSEAVALFPTRPHINTVRRWSYKGFAGVRLKTVRFAGRRFTSRQWAEEFKAKLLKKQAHHSDTLTAAERKLSALGVGEKVAGATPPARTRSSSRSSKTKLATNRNCMEVDSAAGKEAKKSG